MLQKPNRLLKEQRTFCVALHSNINHYEASTSGVLKAICIFCNHERKRVNRNIETLGSCETKETEKLVNDAALILYGTYFLAGIGQIDVIARKARFLHSCRNEYINKAKREQSTFTNNYYTQESAFQRITDYVKEHVLNDS